MDIQAFSDELIHYGRQERMQDLAILPSGSQMEVTFSKSYLRKTYQVLTNEEAQQLITRFKFLGGMEVGERRKAQLGAVSYPLGDQLQRLRISTVGDYQGRESLVMRFLYPLTQEHLRYFFCRRRPTDPTGNQTKRANHYHRRSCGDRGAALFTAANQFEDRTRL